MNRMYFRLLLSIIAIHLACLSFSQVVITPHFQGSEVFTADHLIQLSCVNASSNSLRGFMEIEIEGADKETVATLTSFPIQLDAGKLYNGSDIHWQAGFSYGASAFTNAFRQTGRLPFGEFVICYRFVDNENNQLLGLNCQEQKVKVAGLPRLTFPNDGAVLDNNLPVLTWLPPFPLVSGVKYHLLLVELKENQTEMEAIIQNAPLLSIGDIDETLLPYPPSAKGLKPSKKYVWQITASWNNIEIGKTDIWHFEIEDAVARSSSAGDCDHYYWLTPDASAKGGYYLREDLILPIVYENRALDQELTFSIKRIGESENYVQDLPYVFLFNGGMIVHLDLDLTNVTNMPPNHRYLLEVIDGKGDHYYLDFFNPALSNNGNDNN